MDLDAGQEAAAMREEAGQRQVVASPQIVGKAVQPDGMQPRIAGEHLEGGTGGRILGEYGLDILPRPITPTAEPASVPFCHIATRLHDRLS
jgi:hypothetical protein